MKKHTHKSAFSLVEIIVAFSVLVLVMVASTNLLVSIIRSNTENENTIVAYGLAQEGLEGVRNMRDSNWLLGADFHGYVGGKSGVCVWAGGVCFPDVVGDKKEFTIDVQNVQAALGGNQGGNPDLQAMPNFAPWKLQDVTSVGGEPDPQKTRLCVGSDSLSGAADVWYATCGDASLAKKSLFSRFVEVYPMAYGNADVMTVKKYFVTAVVKWTEVGRPKEVRLSTELTDWKGGSI